MTSAQLKQQWLDTYRELRTSIRYDHEGNRASRRTNSLRKRLNELAARQSEAEVCEAFEAFIAKENIKVA
jgi:acyl carrier protein phosphodiesterase